MVLLGCSGTSSFMHYSYPERGNTPLKGMRKQAKTIDRSKSSAIAIVNPVIFTRLGTQPTVNNPIAKDMQRLFAQALYSSTPWSKVETPTLSNDQSINPEAIVFTITCDDSLEQNFAESKYQLQCNATISKNSVVLDEFIFVDKNRGSFTGLKNIIHKPMKKMIKEFSLFLNEKQFHRASGSSLEPGVNEYQIFPRRKWQKARRSLLPLVHVEFNAGMLLEMEEAGDVIINDRTYSQFEGGPLFSLDVSTNAFALPNGYQRNSYHRTLTAIELFSRFNFARTWITLRDTSAKEVISEDTGGKSTYNLTLGVRPVIRFLSYGSVYGSIGVGLTYFTQKGDVIPKEDSGIETSSGYLISRVSDESRVLKSMAIGLGVRAGNLFDKYSVIFEETLIIKNLEGGTPAFGVRLGVRTSL